MNIQTITHFDEDDQKFYRDYLSVEVVVDGKVAQQYGDSYHDKGTERAAAFVEGLTFGKDVKNWTHTKLNVADGKM